MSLSAPSRRIPPQCQHLPALFSTPLPIRARRTPQHRLLSQTTPRQADGDNRSKNPVLEEYQRKYGNESRGVSPQQMPTPGDLGPSSIFEDERRTQGQRQAAEPSTTGPSPKAEGRNPANMAPVLDPDPNARERWERKKVIQLITKGARLSKAVLIKRTEREHLVKSHMMKTSVKKLGMLARQIQGKRLGDAITQMRFSEKKVAQEVLSQLEFARDEAVVMRGMGLGKAGPDDAEETHAASGASASGEPIEIRLKDGKRHAVADKSQIYIDQAWVGRGPYGKLPEYRARGQINIMRTPWTSITLLLKEEETRVREWRERETKRLKKRKEKVWVPLPDRPVNGAAFGRGWYGW